MAVKASLAADFLDMGREIFDEMVDPGEKYVVPEVYDETSGAKLTDEVEYDVEFVIEDIDDGIEELELVPGFIRAICMQEELPVVPKQGDIIVNDKGVRFNVDHWEEDPAHIIWQIEARKQ